jgi:hypothetical protein
MKEVRISLSEERLAEVEAEIASGQFARFPSWSSGRCRLTSSLPTEAEMVAELAAMRDDLAEGGRLLDPNEVRRLIRDSLAE